MNRLLRAWAGAAALATLSLSAQAALVTASFDGSIAGMRFGDPTFTSYPIGTPVSFSVTFNDPISDGVYSPGESVGPGTGTLTVGAGQYVLNSATAVGLSFGFNGALTELTVHFGGTGPGADGGFFYGLFIGLRPGLTAGNDALIGFGFPSTGGTLFRYARASGEFAFAAVPAPATPALVLAGLAWIGLVRRRTSS